MQTTDSELHRRVLSRLESISDLSKQEIGIAVHDGVVTLSGRTDTYEHKFVVEQTVARIPGITALAIDLRVGRPRSHELTDTEIAHALADILQWSLTSRGEGIVGKVERGWVTLIGEVGLERERIAVEESVSEIDGVRGVVNMITVRPHPGYEVIGEDKITP
jgi:osmotically-inducible protein OsmY